MNARGATPDTVRPVACVRAFPAAIPATCVPCEELSPSNASAAFSYRAPGGGNARAAITFAVVKRCWPFGKTGRHRVAGRVEERVTLIHTGVDHADLDTLTCRFETGAPDGRCADLLWASVELRDVSRRGEHVAHSGDIAEQRHLCAREHDGEAVRDDPIAPADPCIGEVSLRGATERHAAPRRCAFRCPESVRGGPRPGRRRPPLVHRGAPPYRTCRQLDGAEREHRGGHCEQRGDPGHREMRRAEARIGRPRGCGGIGRRARFRSVCPKGRGGSSPLIRIIDSSRYCTTTTAITTSVKIASWMRPSRIRVLSVTAACPDCGGAARWRAGSLDRGTVVGLEATTREEWTRSCFASRSSCSRLLFPPWIALSLPGRPRPYSVRPTGGARVGDLRSREGRAARSGVLAAGPAPIGGAGDGFAALTRLARAHHLAAPRLLRRALEDPDPRIANAAVRSLGDLGDGWAIDILISALRDGTTSRSRIAAQLERLAPVPGPRFVPLLRYPHPAVRFWAATLLGPYPELGREGLISLTWDPDPNVRAAAVETLGNRSGNAVGAATLARLDDPEWFVRVHAARAAGHVVGAEAAPSITPLLADRQWWVRTAAKDALRGMGSDAVPALLAVLGHPRTLRAKRRRRGPFRTSGSSTPWRSSSRQPASRTYLRGGRRAVARGGPVARCAARLSQNRARGMTDPPRHRRPRLPGLPPADDLRVRRARRRGRTREHGAAPGEPGARTTRHLPAHASPSL